MIRWETEVLEYINQKKKSSYDNIRIALQDLYLNQFKTVPRLATFLKVSTASTYKQFKKLGIETYDRSTRSQFGSGKVLIKDLNTTNMSIKEISEYAGVNQTWVVRVCKAYGKAFKSAAIDYASIISSLDTSRMTPPQVAEFVGCAIPTALRILKQQRKAYVNFQKTYKINHKRGCWVHRETGEPYSGSVVAKCRRKRNAA